MVYYKRIIDAKLQEWKSNKNHKPLLLRGARQVGKSTAVKELGKSFRYFVEVNLEKKTELQKLFTENIDVKKTCEKLSGTLSIPIIPGESLLFIDEIQVCKEAIMALRYFKEDYPELHVIAAGSLLEFTLAELPSFGVGRISSLYMYPFSFDEFLSAQGLDLMVEYKKNATSIDPLTDIAHETLKDQLRTFFLVGGMPAAVTEWIDTHSYLDVSHIHNEIIDTYQDDFSKYTKKTNPLLLRQVLRSVAQQAGTKFVFTLVSKDTKSIVIKEALHLLSLAGLITPVIHTNANGLPLGAEENNSYIKYLFFDLGVMQTMLKIPAADIIMSSDVDFVNKGSASEMFAGLELIKYSDCYMRPDLNYWQNMTRNGQAEIDYLKVINGNIVPIEVKANTRGSMQSLWIFMRKHKITYGIRTSLENFGELITNDTEDNSERHIDIIPLYALSSIHLCE